MKKFLPVAMIAFLIFAGMLIAQTPKTVAEATNYEKTSLYKDVVRFIHDLQKETDLLRVENIGKSAEGRDIPLMIVGNPIPSSPNELKYDGRAVIYFQANIHAGEVEGKEAVLMLVRDILAEKKPEYLDKFVLLITPIFNADGNDKLSERNRRDNGPKEAGIRYNGMNLDLNRDGMKQESPEVRALMKNVFNKWDPLLFVDCHTTNGSYHEEPVTYLWGMNPNGDKPILEYMHSELLPKVDEILEKKYDVLSIPYGNFRSWKEPEKGWSPAGPQPMYITNYIGLRNRYSILLENYAYADFKTRVHGNYYFLKSVLDFCASHKDEMVKMASDADRKTIELGMRIADTDSFAIEYSLQQMDKKVTIKGFEHEEYTMQNGRKRYRKGDKKVTYKIPLWHDWVAKRQVRRPAGYFLTLHDDQIVKNLKGHGIIVEQLLEPVTTQVESFLAEKITPAKRLYQGHYQNRVEGKYETGEMTFQAGTYYVSTAQPLGNVIVYLLEPEADSGLMAWNFFDRYIVRQWGRGAMKAPVYKCYTRLPMVKETVTE